MALVGLVLAKEAVDTSGSVGQDFIAHRTPGSTTATVPTVRARSPSKLKLPGSTATRTSTPPPWAAATARRSSTPCITLAKALDSLSSSSDRQNPDKIYEAIKSVGSGGGFEELFGQRGPG